MPGSVFEKRTLRCVASLLFSLQLGACGGEGGLEIEASRDTTPTESPLIDAVPTTERPAIGMLVSPRGQCTATLIHPQVVITAKHCAFSTTCNEANCGSAHQLAFYTTPETGGFSTRWGVERWQSFSVHGDPTSTDERSELTRTSVTRRYALNDDVALVLLERAIPEEVASPVPIASEYPPAHTAFTLFGFGCSNRVTREGELTKRKRTVGPGQSSNFLCAGDSGGPVLSHETGELYFVNSGSWMASAGGATIEMDMFGDVIAARDKVNTTLARWGLDHNIIESGDSPKDEDNSPLTESDVESTCARSADQAPPTISLLWTERTDLDLHVLTPSGDHIYFNNVVGDRGERLDKADCVRSSCPELNADEVYSEWIEWRELPPASGEYVIWAVNYGEELTAHASVFVEFDDHRATFEQLVEPGLGESERWSFSYERGCAE